MPGDVLMQVLPKPVKKRESARNLSSEHHPLGSDGGLPIAFFMTLQASRAKQDQSTSSRVILGLTLRACMSALSSGIDG